MTQKKVKYERKSKVDTRQFSKIAKPSEYNKFGDLKCYAFRRKCKKCGRMFKYCRGSREIYCSSCKQMKV